MTSLAHSPVNDTRSSDLYKEVRELGRDSAQGADAYAKLFLRVTQAAAEGVVTLDKDNNNRDDAYRLLEEFVEAKAKKATHERTTDSVKAQAAKIRAGIKTGIKNGSRAIEALERAKILREEMIEAKLPVKAAYPALQKVAQMDYASDTPLTDDQVKEYVAKVKADKDLEDELRSVESKMDALVVGKNGIQCQDTRLVSALENIRSLRAELEIVRKKAEIIDEMRELGMDVFVDTTVVTAEVPLAA